MTRPVLNHLRPAAELIGHPENGIATSVPKDYLSSAR
jgi:hypothetical protein